MKKYTKPALERVDMSLPAVIMTTCVDNAFELEPNLDADGNIIGYWWDGWAVFAQTNCEMNMDGRFVPNDPAGGSIFIENDTCLGGYSCYHSPEDDNFNTLFGS